MPTMSTVKTVLWAVVAIAAISRVPMARNVVFGPAA